MKKYISLFFILLMTAAAHAQTVGTTARELSQLSRQVARAAGESSFQMQMLHMAGLTGGQAFQLTQSLQRKAQAALEQARAASGNIRFPLTLPGEVTPVVDMKIRDKWQLKPHLQGMPNLKKTRDIAAYLISQENLLFVQEMKRLEQHVWPQIEANMKRLEQAAQNTPQPADPLRYVAQHLPLSVNTLFVGEMHGFGENSQAVHKLLVNLRQAQPNRPIILFTEFLPEYFRWKGKIPWKYNSKNFLRYFWASGFDLEYKRTLWEAAREINITTVGLEPYQACLTDDAKLKVDFPYKEDERFNASLIGLQYRNEKFLEVLRAYRELNPNALFVVYTGAGHVEYHQFASVSTHFNPETTFVLGLVPSVERIAKKLHTKEDYAQECGHPIRNFTWTGEFPQNFQLFNKELAPIAGVDAFIRLEAPKE